MTPTTLAALGASLWLGGAVTVGALAMHHSVARAAEIVEPTQSIAQIYDRIPPPAPLYDDEVISLPNMTIVGAAPTHVAKPVHEVRCTPWRPLQQGSNMVQTCE